VVTSWGFGFHQEAAGSNALLGSTDARLTAHAAPTTYGRFDFLLRVDRGDGAQIFDVSVDPAPASVDAARAALERALADAVVGSDYGYGEKSTTEATLAAAGLKVEVSGGKLQIVATANGTLEQGLLSTHVIPARMELTVKGANTIVASNGSFENLETIKLGDGANTFVFGNDYWGGGSSALSLAQALPLVDVIARNSPSIPATCSTRARDWCSTSGR